MSLDKSEAKRYRELLDDLYELRKNRIWKMDEFNKDIEQLTIGESNARKQIREATTPFELNKAKAIAESFTREKNIIRERRFVIKLMDMAEEKLKLEILKLETGVE